MRSLQVLLTALVMTPLAMPALAQQSAQPVTGTGQRLDVEPNQQDTFVVIIEEARETGFLGGSTLAFKPRTYFLHRDRDTKPDNVGWALGGSLEYKSGWAAELFQVAATLYTSQILYGPEEKDGTLLFQPGPEQFTVLGEANVTARLGASDLFRIGRQSLDLPWLARHDIRMAPNTFEAVVVGRSAKKGLVYVAGYVDGIKRKNDDEFISMSEAAGAAGSDEGLGLLAAQYTFDDGSLIGATNQATFEVMNTFFIKAERSFEISPGASFRLNGQYTDQRSIGEELIGDFSTYLAAVKGELFWGNSSVRLAASTAGDEKGLQSPFGGPPNYASIIVDNFDRAGEDSLMIGASYDFKDVGLKGLSLFSNISTGRTPNSGPNASPDETEYDLTVDYRASGKANGLWVRARAAWIDQDEGEAGGDDFFDFRVIVNYTFDIL
jgi:hypothetical protein